MTVFFLRRDPLDRTKALLEGGGLKLRCALGRSGIVTRKREGDGGTPRAILKPLQIYMRRDHWRGRAFAIPNTPIESDMGWCDDVRSSRYNRLIRTPFALSHEKLWREDHLYDVIIEMSWNARPAIRGRGSAIFIHLARTGLLPTEGCLALNRKDMSLFIAQLTRQTRIVIR